jgi:hypothetical protein
VAMIELYERYGSTVLELAHGQANALDIELCAALGAFRVTKAQLRLSALQRIDATEVVAGDHVISLWAAAETLAAVRRYVERTLGGAA